MTKASFSVKVTPGDWRTKEWRWKLVSYPSGRADFPVESCESWATKVEAEAVCARVNAGDEAGVSFASYADD